MQPVKQDSKNSGNKANDAKAAPTPQVATKPLTTPQNAGPVGKGNVFGGEPLDEKDIPTPTVQLTKDEKLKLLETVFAAEKAFEAAEAAVLETKARISLAVRDLVSKAGPGPWRVGGTLIKTRLYGKEPTDYACLVRPNDLAVEDL